VPFCNSRTVWFGSLFIRCFCFTLFMWEHRKLALTKWKCKGSNKSERCRIVTLCIHILSFFSYSPRPTLCSSMSWPKQHRIRSLKAMDFVRYKSVVMSQLMLHMKMAVFWIVAPCSLVEVYQRFRGPYCLHHQGDETFVNFYQTTRRYNPQESHLRTHRHENLKSYWCYTWSDDISRIFWPTGYTKQLNTENELS
jgi:hypothetical protein